MTVETLGAGEIILNVIERDGMMEGYDLDLIAKVSDAVSIPVVACGGAGTYEDFAQALDHGAHAVAAGAMFAFTDQTPAGAAEYLASRGYPVRRNIAA
jgi:cyclase